MEKVTSKEFEKNIQEKYKKLETTCPLPKLERDEHYAGFRAGMFMKKGLIDRASLNFIASNIFDSKKMLYRSYERGSEEASLILVQDNSRFFRRKNEITDAFLDGYNLAMSLE